MRKFVAMVLFLAATMVAFAGGQRQDVGRGDAVSSEATTVSISHKYGTAEVPVKPDRVVVFAYDILDVLDTLGLPVTAVAKSNIPPALGKYSSTEYVDAGSLFEPLFEDIYAVNPQVIFISDRQTPVYDQLAEIAPVVYTTVDPTDYLGSLRTNWTHIGRIFGVEDQIATRLAALDVQVAELADASQASSALFVMVNDTALSAYGPGSRFGFVYDNFGFSPADPNMDASTHGAAITFEYLREVDPSVLFVLDRAAAIGGTGTARTVLANDIVAGTSAARSGRIVYVDGAAWYLSIGGIQANEAILTDLAAGMASAGR